MSRRMLIKNIGVLQTPIGSHKHCGEAQGENLKLQNAAVLIEDGLIVDITGDGELPRGAERATMMINANGSLVTPGLIDAHTHLVFGGWRQHELAMKLHGATYLDILAAGGGILDTVAKTRAASEEELYQKGTRILDDMLRHGVTTAEIKSGYGLDLETELKQLRVVKRLGDLHPVATSATFLGAHAVPPEYKGRADEYIEFIIETVLPEVKKQRLAKACDIFCETGVFDAAQSRRLLTAAQELGFRLRVHADEIDEIGGAALAGELGALTAEHLIATGEAGADALAAGGVIAALLPQTSFYLDKTYAAARMMIGKGIPVAIASDFNPGSCPSYDLQFAMTLGCLKYKMTPEEVLSAVTVNAACAVGMESRVGTLEIGKQADLVVWDAPDLETVCYRFGVNLAHIVIKNGEKVV